MTLHPSPTKHEIVALLKHARNGDLAGVTAFVDKYGIDIVNAQSHILYRHTGMDEFTPLMYAASAGHDAVVSFLITRGAVIDLRNQYGETALHVAAHAGRAHIVRLLLDLDADPLALDKSGKTAAEGHRHTEISDMILNEPMRRVAALKAREDHLDDGLPSTRAIAPVKTPRFMKRRAP